jgi:hypothetical protein
MIRNAATVFQCSQICERGEWPSGPNVRSVTSSCRRDLAFKIKYGNYFKSLFKNTTSREVYVEASHK